MSGNTLRPDQPQTTRPALRRQSQRRVARLAIAMVFVAALTAAARGDDIGTSRKGALTLSNGDTVVGRLLPSESPGSIRWQDANFRQPFEFRLGAIKSIKFPVEPVNEVAKGAFAFEFTSGDVITAALSVWDGETIELDSQQFGRLVVRADSVRRMHRIEENATLVFGSLAGLQDWTTTTWDTSGWDEDGDHLWTNRAGATLNGDLGVPDRAVVEFEISWSDQPDFVFAVGVDTESTADRDTDGWRFETAGGKLAVVREQTGTADVDVIADLTQLERIRLVAYLDQASGEMQVFLPDGTAVARVAPQRRDDGSSDSRPGRGVRLINRGSQLRLERLRIAKWLGGVPDRAAPGQASVALADGSFVSGVIRRLDAESNTLVLGDDAQKSSVNLDQVIAVKLASGESAEVAQCAVFLHGGMRLSGNLDSIDEENWIITGESFAEAVRIPRDRVRTMIVFQRNAGDGATSLASGRLGRLELGGHRLTGRLAAAVADSSNESSCLRWHPVGSRNAATLRTGVSGRIVYRDPPANSTATAAARALAMQRLRLQQQKRGLNFGELFLKRADSSKSQEPKRDAHVVHIRSGDVIACRVESIDRDGVHLSTIDSDQGFVPHDDIKAIEFVANSPPPDLKQAKRERLLTIPRLQKSSPPSHLLCSHNGDFLRCRLLRVDEEMIHLEVQLEELKIPRDRVAQIIWFHPDETSPETLKTETQISETNVPAMGPTATEEAAEDNAVESGAEEPDSNEPESGDSELPVSVEVGSRFVGKVQALQRDGKRVTFEPLEITEKSVAGSSDVLGACRFEIAEIDQLIIGSRIASEVSELAYNQWKLHPAIEPLVAQATEGGPAVGNESPLIGQQAPDLQLEWLDGGDFELSQCEGQIVVLDFWATWCAPCMQTMPLVEAAIAEFDPQRVRLVSINLEEPAEHVRAVLERHELNVPVVLDLDGVAAARYQARAIPQLVIVGADGKVQRLYVGGGAGVVEQMKAAISELLDSPSS